MYENSFDFNCFQPICISMNSALALKPIEFDCQSLKNRLFECLGLKDSTNWNACMSKTLFTFSQGAMRLRLRLIKFNSLFSFFLRVNPFGWKTLNQVSRNWEKLPYPSIILFILMQGREPPILPTYQDRANRTNIRLVLTSLTSPLCFEQTVQKQRKATRKGKDRNSPEETSGKSSWLRLYHILIFFVNS